MHYLQLMPEGSRTKEQDSRFKEKPLAFNSQPFGVLPH